MHGLVETYNRIACDYAKDHEADTWGYELIDQLLELAGSEETILDIGCGPGYECAYIARSGRKVLGVDFSPAMIREARERHPSLDFEVMDMKSLDFPQGAFGAIVCRSALHHIPHSEALSVLRSMVRVLKPGGLLYIAVKRGKGEATETERDYGYPYQRFYAYYRENDLRELCSRLRLSVLRTALVKGANHSRVQVLARKCGIICGLAVGEPALTTL